MSHLPRAGISIGAVFTNSSNSVPSSPATLTVTTSPNAASLVSIDTTTQGGWSNVYGADGYDVIGSSESLPSYASLLFSGANEWTWTSNTSQTQALQSGPNAATRIAAAMYAQSFTANVNVGSGQHQVAFYLMDYDVHHPRRARSEQVQIIDPANGTVLQTQTVSNSRVGRIWFSMSPGTSP